MVIKQRSDIYIIKIYEYLSHEVTIMSDTKSSINKDSVLRAKMRSICVTARESDRQKISARMSPESIKISNGTKWSENGFVPSFKNTDKILMKAALQTYNSHITQNR